MSGNTIKLSEEENIIVYELINKYYDCEEEEDQEILLSVMKKLSE
jgi:hypothetical protein